MQVQRLLYKNQIQVWFNSALCFTELHMCFSRLHCVYIHGVHSSKAMHVKSKSLWFSELYIQSNSRAGEQRAYSCTSVFSRLYCVYMHCAHSRKVMQVRTDVM